MSGRRSDWSRDGIRYEGLLEEGSLWIMVAAPCVWAAHFLLSYWIVAVWCAKVEPGPGSLLAARIAVAALTAIALAMIGWLSLRAWRRYEGRLTIDDDLVRDTQRERTRFLGHAALLLAALSAVGVLFDALPALAFPSCR